MSESVLLKLMTLPSRGRLLVRFLIRHIAVTELQHICSPRSNCQGNRLLQFCDKMVTKSRTSAINVGADIIRPKETDGGKQHFHGLYDIV